MAPRRNNKRPKPKKNLFTPEGIPDKDFNPMAGWQESPEAENSTFNKRTLECSEQDELQANPKRISLGTFDDVDDETNLDPIEEQLFGSISNNENTFEISSTPLKSSTTTTPSRMSLSSNTLDAKSDVSIHIAGPVNMKDLEYGNVLQCNSFFPSKLYRLSGRNSLTKLRERGLNKPHFASMKLPKNITITVLGSTEPGRRHSINIHYEILVRKLLNIFAENPAEFAPVHSFLSKKVSELSDAGSDMLITPELFDAMIRNPTVSYQLLYYDAIF